MDDPLATPIPDYAHRVAMYDMDRTITRSGTYSGFLMHVARQRQQWRLLLLPLVGVAGAAYALRLIDRARLKAINLRLLVGKRFSRSEIARWPKATPTSSWRADCTQQRSNRSRPIARQGIGCSSQLHPSTSMSTRSRSGWEWTMYSRPGSTNPMAPTISMRGCRAAIVMATRNSRAFPDRLSANEITRDQMHVRAYSDHVSDHPMLHFADEAVATTPSRKLKQLAPRMGWQVVDWRARR